MKARRGLRWKAMTTVGGLMFFLSLTLAGFIFASATKEAGILRSQRVNLLAEQVAHRWMQATDRLDEELLSSLLSNFVEDPFLEGAAVLDRHGQVIARAGTVPESIPGPDNEHWSQADRAPMPVDSKDLATNAPSPFVFAAFVSPGEETRSLLGAASSILWIVLGVTMAAIILAWISTQSLILPLLQLVRATGQVADGDRTAPVATKRRDELGLLSRAFQRMADRIIAVHEDLEAHNASLELAVEQRKRELQSAYQETEQVDQLKDNLLQNVALRMDKPLENLRQATEQLATAAPESAPSHATLLLQRGRNLEGIVDDALDCAALESPDLEWDRSATDVAELLALGKEHLGERFSRRDQTCAIAMPDFGGARFLWQRQRMQQVFRYLLATLARQSPLGAELIVEGRCTDSQTAAICFTSQGGSETDHSEPFPPAGLGLCQEVVERHGGSLTTPAENSGGFELQFPLSGEEEVVTNSSGPSSRQVSAFPD